MNLLPQSVTKEKKNEFIALKNITLILKYLNVTTIASLELQGKQKIKHTYSITNNMNTQDHIMYWIEV